ncbi:MAG: proline iminopeptidase [Bacteroidia bacterium]|jgi:proline iminopeptidase
MKHLNPITTFFRQFTLVLCLVLGFQSCVKEGVPAKGRTIFVRTSGADMPVYLHGNADSKVVILLIHGGPGGNGIEYRSGTYAELLEEKYVMAYLDQRGQGSSRKVNSDYEVTMNTLINDVSAVVSVLKAELGSDVKVYLFGHSWGGTLGTGYLLANDNQKNIQGWIEADGAHDIPLLNKEAIKMFRKVGQDEIAKGNNTGKWQEIVNWAYAIDTNNISDAQGGEINEKAYEAEELINELGESDRGGIPYRVLYSPVDPIISSLVGNATSSALDADGIESLAYTNQLYKITIPSLFLWGKYDFVVPPRLGKSGFDNIGSADKELILFNQSGHSPMNTEPAAFANAIIEFVERTK